MTNEQPEYFDDELKDILCGPDFDIPSLVKHFGTWMKVQVAFYDFLFISASNLCPAHWNEELGMKNMTDGEAFYDNTTDTIARNFPTSTEAWQKFLEHCRTELHLDV